ncbi:quinone oxidoreductase [Mycobacterium tuberculosis]|nr:quinone oxidoreductase [Mycobacterium tuberculosis]
MHAIEVTETGGPGVLRHVDQPQPQPGHGELLIKAEAIGVNFIDTYFRSGQYPRELPFVIGSEVCGTVEAVGPGVTAADTAISVGDRVVSASANGAYAEFCTAPASLTAKVPDDVTSEVAASALLKGLTAHYLLKSVYPVKRGDTVLVHAGAGGVGLILTQWATHLGVRVITTVSTAEKAKLSKDAGADVVLDYPEDASQFAGRVRELTGGKSRLRRCRRHHLRRQPSQPGCPRDISTVRRRQRSGSTGRSAAPQCRRIGVPHPSLAVPLHPHRRGVQLAGR